MLILMMLFKIAGEDTARWFSFHGLCSTLPTILFEHDHSDSPVAMCMGYRDLNSLKSLQHLGSKTRLQQQQDFV